MPVVPLGLFLIPDSPVVALDVEQVTPGHSRFKPFVTIGFRHLRSLLPVTRVVAVRLVRRIPLSQVFSHFVVNQLHPCFHRVLFCFDGEAMPLEERPRCDADVG